MEKGEWHCGSSMIASNHYLCVLGTFSAPPRSLREITANATWGLAQKPRFQLLENLITFTNLREPDPRSDRVEEARNGGFGSGSLTQASLV